MSDPYSLNNLRDIVEPAAVSIWPPATAVYLLGAFLIVWLTAAISLYLLHRKKNLYRRVGMRELAIVKKHLGDSEEQATALRDLNVLVKRVALAAWPRKQVASLTGDAWLAFLVETSHASLFANGAGLLLTKISVANTTDLKAISPEDITRLVDAAGRWIKTHRVNVPPSSMVDQPDTSTLKPGID